MQKLRIASPTFCYLSSLGSCAGIMFFDANHKKAPNEAVQLHLSFSELERQCRALDLSLIHAYIPYTESIFKEIVGSFLILYSPFWVFGVRRGSEMILSLQAFFRLHQFEKGRSTQGLELQGALVNRSEHWLAEVRVLVCSQPVLSWKMHGGVRRFDETI